MTKNKIVADTNVLISAAIKKDGLEASLVAHVPVAQIFLFTADTFKEFAQTLAKEKFDKYIPLKDRGSFLEKLVDQSLLVKPTLFLEICRDPKGNKFISLAEQEKAKYLITGDQDLLVIKPELITTKIITPRQFLEYEKQLSHTKNHGLIQEKSKELVSRIQPPETRERSLAVHKPVNSPGRNIKR